MTYDRVVWILIGMLMSHWINAHKHLYDESNQPSASDTTKLVSCEESSLIAAAQTILTIHYDVEMGATAPGSIRDVGFQYLKTPDALRACQAIAHTDFDQAATQYRQILTHQHSDGNLPLLVYGPSVNRYQKWINTTQTFFPGPGFWNIATDTNAPTSTVLAPPIAADVAWQLYRLSPYETAAMGVTQHQDEAVRFLCEVYRPLQKLHNYIFSRNQTSTRLLTSHHPWETFPPLSRHWESALSSLQQHPQYQTIIATIPESAKTRFVNGARPLTHETNLIKDQYEPMIFLAFLHASESHYDVGVEDIAFNALVLRSVQALINISRVLLERSSVCPNFATQREHLHADLERYKSHAHRVHTSIMGDDNNEGLWNTSAALFNDADTTIDEWSLRNTFPAFTIQMPDQQNMGLLSHFIPSPPIVDTNIPFLCAGQFPVSYFPCNARPIQPAIVMTVYNDYLQQSFALNKFSGLASFVRNSTRDLVCRANAFSIGFHPETGQAFEIVDDSSLNSTLSAAILINMLLPRVRHPPSPDTPPIDHRMLIVIMCIELVVAFGVALVCVFLSVYFVVNRPPSVPQGQSGKRDEPLENDQASVMYSSIEDGTSGGLEESLLSESDDEHEYGSFNRFLPSKPVLSERWKTLKDALASISPW